jgi:hypothetical protein
MSRIITLLFRRDPSRDRQIETCQFEGYRPLWPDGRPVALGVDALCKHGTRLLGLGKYLVGCDEKLVRLVCMPLTGRDDNLNRIPGHRVRRFYLLREGQGGRLHFMDGTPTTATFELDRDEPSVLNWLGLPGLADGEVQWFDLAAMAVETAAGSRPCPTDHLNSDRAQVRHATVADRLVARPQMS